MTICLLGVVADLTCLQVKNAFALPRSASIHHANHPLQTAFEFEAISLVRIVTDELGNLAQLGARDPSFRKEKR